MLNIMLNSHEYFRFYSTFKYLGSIFDPSLDDSLDIRKHINKAFRAFATMKKVLTSRDLPKALRLHTYKATILNILLFGCESWALTISDLQAIKVAHNRFLR